MSVETGKLETCIPSVYSPQLVMDHAARALIATSPVGALWRRSGAGQAGGARVRQPCRGKAPFRSVRAGGSKRDPDPGTLDRLVKEARRAAAGVADDNSVVFPEVDPWGAEIAPPRFLMKSARPFSGSLSASLRRWWP